MSSCSRCSGSKARAHAVPTTTALAVGTERPRRQRRRVSTRHQSIQAARHFKSIPRRATLSALYGGAAAQGARPGPGRVPGRAARGNPRTSLVPRDVDRRIGSRWRCVIGTRRSYPHGLRADIVGSPPHLRLRGTNEDHTGLSHRFSPSSSKSLAVKKFRCLKLHFQPALRLAQPGTFCSCLTVASKSLVASTAAIGDRTTKWQQLTRLIG